MTKWKICMLMAVSVGSSSFAEAPSTENMDTLAFEVERNLIAPLNNNTRKLKAFSRAVYVESDRPRRVRFAKTGSEVDKFGHAFHRFSIDRASINGESWILDEIVGCIYPETLKIFVVKLKAKAGVHRAVKSLKDKVDLATDGLCAKMS